MKKCKSVEYINNNLPKIIILSGAKRCGKDTFAKYLTENYGYHHHKITEKLKEIIKILFDLNDLDLEENKEEVNEVWGATPRKMMQFIGTEIFQYKIQEIVPNINKKFWIKSLFNETLKDNLNNKEDYRIVISDLRFIHEWEEINKMNLSNIHIRITNNKLNYKKDTHISENELYKIPYNYEIKNNSDINDFHHSIKNLIKIFNQNI